jgi:hypothetical protein
VFTTCPHCSILFEGSCHPCQEGDEHPSCEYCVGGKYYPPPDPWYKSQIFLAVVTSVVVAVSSALVVAKIQESLEARKR